VKKKEKKEKKKKKKTGRLPTSQRQEDNGGFQDPARSAAALTRDTISDDCSTLIREQARSIGKP
jgi:hypothetical protein